MRIQTVFREEEGGEGGSNGGSGSSDFNLSEHIPAEFKDDPAMKDIKDINGLVSSFVNGQRMIGNSIRLPGEMATEDDRNAFYEKLQTVDGVTRIPDLTDAEAAKPFYQKLGMPETADKYSYETPKDIPDGVQLDTSLADEFKEVAYGLGLNQKQYQAAVEFVTNKNLEALTAKHEARNETIEILKKEWGPQYAARHQMATELLKQHGTQELYEELEAGLGNNPGLLMMLSNLAQLTLEDNPINIDKESGKEFTKTVTEIDHEIAEHMASSAYTNKNEPNHKAVVDKVRILNEQKYALQQQKAS